MTPAERARLEQTTGLIFDVQRYALHDGPGLRTDVFFKGCPLRCGWCSNPESQQARPELMLFAQECIRCGQFAEDCPAIWGGRDRADYAERMTRCPTAAIHWSGRERTAGDALGEVLRDAPFYANGGGLTLTGGEPTAQPELADALLRLAKAAGVSTAMETCGRAPWAVFKRLLPALDHLLYDLKHLDSEAHRAGTGVGNDLILANLRRLLGAGAPVTIRVPLIPGFNADPASLRAMAGFARELGVDRLDLLPYHTYGTAKYAALARAYPWAAQPRLTAAEIAAFAQLFEAAGLTVNIGG